MKFHVKNQDTEKIVSLNVIEIQELSRPNGLFYVEMSKLDESIISKKYEGSEVLEFYMIEYLFVFTLENHDKIIAGLYTDSDGFTNYHAIVGIEPPYTILGSNTSNMGRIIDYKKYTEFCEMRKSLPLSLEEYANSILSGNSMLYSSAKIDNKWIDHIKIEEMYNEIF